jgi:pilus assembly protein CpaF
VKVQPAAHRTNGHDSPVAEVRELEAVLRRLVADDLAQQRRELHSAGKAPLDRLDERQLARSVLLRQLHRRNEEALQRGDRPLGEAEQHELVDGVLAQVFSPLPGLERHLSRDEVVNVHVLGTRETIVELIDGSTERHASPFGSHREMVDVLDRVARRSGVVEGEFNFSHPILRVALPDGSRLSANAWIGPEPYLTIRRHPLIDRDLADLRDLGMLDDGVRTLIGAAVRAHWNILFAGGQSAGKTTLMRAATHEADPSERTIVVEAVPELHLDRLPDRHNHVVALHERPPNIEGDGAITLADLAWHAKHLSPDRILVGEVLADEVVPMLEAMSQGLGGGMCTMHARSSAGVFPRLPVYARTGGRDWRSSDIWELTAEALDLVVFVARDRDKRRVVAEVRHVERYDHEAERIISDAWYTRDRRTGRAAPTGVIPVHLLDELVDHGYLPQAPDGMGRSKG